MTERLVQKNIDMSPRTEKQFEEIREERRQQIMQVALALIADEGFQQVSIAKIAKQAKISKGLIYNYFESKEELIIQIMNDGMIKLTEYFDPNRDGILTDEEFHLFVDKTFEVLQSNIRFWRMYFMVMVQPLVFKTIGAMIEQTLAPFMNVAVDYFLRKGYEDPIAELRFFAAMLDGVALHFVMNPKKFPLDGVKKKLHSMYK